MHHQRLDWLCVSCIAGNACAESMAGASHSTLAAGGCFGRCRLVTQWTKPAAPTARALHPPQGRRPGEKREEGRRRKTRKKGQKGLQKQTVEEKRRRKFINSALPDSGGFQVSADIYAIGIKTPYAWCFQRCPGARGDCRAVLDSATLIGRCTLNPRLANPATFS